MNILIPRPIYSRLSILLLYIEKIWEPWDDELYALKVDRKEDYNNMVYIGHSQLGKIKIELSFYGK